MVKVGKLWGDAKFASLSPISKLLYCYVTTQPSITTLGVLDMFLDKISFDTKVDEELVLLNLRALQDDNLIKMIPQKDGRYYIVVSDHFKSLSKSKANIRKAIDEAKNSEKGLQDVFRSLFTGSDFEGTQSFKPPTPKEVTEYALSLGYLVSGNTFCEYYGNNDWYDRNDKKVRDWKARVRKVWCRDNNKLETADGAPKGFEYFFVELENGDRIYPESWKNGMPSHSNYIYAQHLTDSYLKVKGEHEGNS